MTIGFQTKFAGPLAALGFDWKEKQLFVREQGDILQIIRFRERFEYRTERFRFDFVLAVHLGAVERMLRPDTLAQLLGTVSCPIHLLRRDRKVHEWYLNDPRCVPEVMSQLAEYGLQFLDRYSDVANVKRQLESEDPSDWFTLSAEERIGRLAAIDAALGRHDEALSILDAALAERKHQRPKKWWALVQLRKRIAMSR